MTARMTKSGHDYVGVTIAIVGAAATGKTAMMLASMDSGEMRLPLCEMSGEHRAALERALFEHEVLACEDEDEAAKS